MAMKLNTFCKD